jgi:hypothetical protein
MPSHGPCWTTWMGFASGQAQAGVASCWHAIVDMIWNGCGMTGQHSSLRALYAQVSAVLSQ